MLINLSDEYRLIPLVSGLSKSRLDTGTIFICERQLLTIIVSYVFVIFREKFAMMFEEPVPLQAHHWYVAWVRVSGPSSDCGSNGQSTITTDEQYVPLILSHCQEPTNAAHFEPFYCFMIYTCCFQPLSFHRRSINYPIGSAFKNSCTAIDINSNTLFRLLSISIVTKLSYLHEISSTYLSF